MNYNDLPTYDIFNWDKFEKDRTGCYKDDLYCFNGNQISLVKPIINEAEEAKADLRRKYGNEWSRKNNR